MQNDDQPLRKYGNIREDEERAKKLPKTAEEKEREARETTVKPEKKG